jgi:hypothetical protein
MVTISINQHLKVSIGRKREILFFEWLLKASEMSDLNFWEPIYIRCFLDEGSRLEVDTNTRMPDIFPHRPLINCMVVRVPSEQTKQGGGGCSS